MHGANLIFLVAELLLDQIAFVPAHVIAVMAFDLVYFLVILLPYQYATGTVIYDGITDFEALPGRAVLSLFGIGAAIVVVFAIFAIITHLKCQFVCTSSFDRSRYMLCARPRRSQSF